MTDVVGPVGGVGIGRVAMICPGDGASYTGFGVGSPFTGAERRWISRRSNLLTPTSQHQETDETRAYECQTVGFGYRGCINGV